jgi:pyruvate carboxylase
MDENGDIMMKNILRYYRSSLADGDRKDINIKNIKEESIVEPNLSSLNFEKIKNKFLSKQNNKDKDDISFISSLLYPMVCADCTDLTDSRGN